MFLYVLSWIQLSILVFYGSWSDTPREIYVTPCAQQASSTTIQTSLTHPLSLCRIKKKSNKKKTEFISLHTMSALLNSYRSNRWNRINNIADMFW